MEEIMKHTKKYFKTSINLMHPLTGEKCEGV